MSIKNKSNYIFQTLLNLMCSTAKYLKREIKGNKSINYVFQIYITNELID